MVKVAERATYNEMKKKKKNNKKVTNQNRLCM